MYLSVHHKDWLTYSGGTDRLGEFCYNFSISNDLTQMVNFPAGIPDCDSHRPALLDLFLSSDPCICSTMAFPPLGNSDHVVVSVSIDFSLNQKDKSSASKVKFRQASNCCKRVLEATKLAYTNKTKESITSQKLGSRDFWRIANSVLNKGKSAISPLFNCPEVLSSASDKAKLFAENFSKNSNLDDLVISLPDFPTRTNLKLHNISVSPKMVTKVITNLDLSKASGPDCVPLC